MGACIADQRTRAIRDSASKVPILNLIFTLFSCDPDMQNNISDDDGVTLPGWSLMAVCSHWHNIALSCTALWRKIQLSAYPSNNGTEEGNNLARLAAPLKWCLDHAGETEPLEISFRADMRELDTPVPEPEFMGILFAQSARWGRLTLNIHFNDLERFPSFAALKNCAMVSLKSLEFYVHHDPNIKVDVFCNAPQLTELTLRTLPTVEMLPWGQIKTLKLCIEFAEDYDIFGALIFCPSLESLSYVFSYYYKLGTSEMPRQSSETIHSLSVLIERGHYVPETLSLLMDAARFPALQEMSINYQGSELHIDIPWPRHKVTSFLLQSGCSLTTLEIENVVISNDDLVALLVRTPELRRFNFYETEIKKDSKAPTSKHQHITMSFITCLHAYGDIEDGDPDAFTNPLVPKLEHLSLRLFIDVPGVVAITVKLKVLGRTLKEELHLVCGTEY
ncbi:hypothetical protein BDP27DRAFT_1312444 [Rhodocollybia butyracea]|uniref:F-box domain-containing protein n=1 Tax=Rhodocollybia butyracea TaxID=206335 RepID=A0A9P5Q300_9AGAR|nr:hypothetical protein BDP27DRAFT_1312444 [Rhodocollybia butyracea]